MKRMKLTIDAGTISSRAESWGANFGIAGALLLALALPASKWGWVLFLASNVGWLVFALAHGYRKLLVQTCVFASTSLLGIANTFFPGNAVQQALAGLFA